jgi:MFS family permease
MFGSITLYSLGNIANAYVETVPQYAILRFITGLGLAGEIGAGITLICEILPKEKRGIGTTLMTGLGVAGAIAAALMGKFLDWRTAYLVGGIMGLALLGLRLITHDSGMFAAMAQQEGIKRGSLRLLFATRERTLRFLSCISLGLPVFLCFGVFAAFSPEITSALGMTEEISVPETFLMLSIGMTIGDLSAGYLSQFWKSRRKPLIIFMICNSLIATAISLGLSPSASVYLGLHLALGFFSGYWACLITISSEQFGTNIRATVTTMVPNLVRATAIPLTMLFITLKQNFSMTTTLLTLTLGCFTCGALGVRYLKETFHKDLDYIER